MANQAPSAKSVVDTTRVTDRRKLRFNTPEEMFRDVEGLVAAEKEGTLRCSGNWTLGQVLGHLAYWTNRAFEPTPVTPPLWVKMLLRVGKNRFLNGPMRVGIRIPNVQGGTLGIEVLSTPEGMSRFERAWVRLRSQAPTQPSAALGNLTQSEAISLNLRHAELHLSFMHPR